MGALAYTAPQQQFDQALCKIDDVYIQSNTADMSERVVRLKGWWVQVVMTFVQYRDVECEAAKFGEVVCIDEDVVDICVQAFFKFAQQITKK